MTDGSGESNPVLYDNVFVFRHLRYPDVCIENPKYVVRIKDMFRNKSQDASVEYVYGCDILPGKSEMRTVILPKRIFENHHDLPFSELKVVKENYSVTVNNKLYNIYG